MTTAGVRVKRDAKKLPARTLLVVMVTALLAAPSLEWLALAQRDVQSPQPAVRTLSTTLERLPAREISTGETHRYWLQLDPGRYLSIGLEQQGIDLGVSILDPAHKAIVEHRFRQPGTIMLSVIAHTAGRHLLEIQPVERVMITGRYIIHVTALRRAEPLDVTREAASRLFAEAWRLRSEGRRETTRSALPRYHRACVAWHQARELSNEAMCTTTMGETHQALGQGDAAIKQFDEALRIASAISDVRGECAALTASARVLADMGRIEDARVRAARALTLSRESPNRPCEAEALNAAGDVATLTGRERDAVDSYKQALAVSQELADRRGQALAMINLGYVSTDLSDLAAGQTWFQQSMALWQQVEDARGEAAALTGLGHLHYRIGEHQEALNYYRKARELFERAGDSSGAGSMLNGMGAVYLRLGEPAAALTYFQRAIELFESTRIASGEVGSRVYAGACHAALGQPAEALREYERALVITRATDDVRLEGRVLEHIGRAKADLGNVDEALQNFEASRACAERLADFIGQAYALTSLGSLLDRQGRPREALAYLERARAAAVEAHSRVAESLAFHALARVKAGLGELEAALTDVRHSLAIVEDLRGDVASLDLRSSYVASVRGQHDLEIELLMRLHEREPSAGYHGLALEASERAHARSLLDGLAEARAGIRQGVDGALLERERSLRQALNAKGQRMAQLPHDASHEKELTGLRSDIDALTINHSDIESQIRAASPAYAALTQPRAITLSEAQQLVPDHDSVLVEYFLGSRQSYVWAVTHTSVVTAALPPREEIERLVRGYTDAIARRGTADRSNIGSDSARDDRASQLSAILLGSIAASLHVPRILLVADGILHTLPFAALPDPASVAADGNVQPLAVDHELVFLPSASTLALLRRDWHRQGHWPRAVMVFADPVFEVDDPRISPAPAASRTMGARKPASASNATDGETSSISRQLDGSSGGIARLLGSRREARAIAASAPGVDLALDFAANREAVMNPRLADYRIIHFATHGVVDNSRPALSGIILSLFDEKGRSEPGFLRLHDIYNLTLPVDLVVLSACSTGLGKEVAGEGLMGLVRGFMYAGSRQVIATLWKVDDQATGELMTRFYDGVLRRGLRPVTALAEAQRQMMRDPRWRDPFYWAPFVLQGDWQ